MTELERSRGFGVHHAGGGNGAGEHGVGSRECAKLLRGEGRNGAGARRAGGAEGEGS